jgi:hypothetical protein
MVPDFFKFMNQMSEKYGTTGKHEVREDALTKALELLEITDNSQAEAHETAFDAESYNPDLIALIATTSPRTIEEYGSHPENIIKNYWTKADGTEYSSETIKEVIRKEKRGEDYFLDQKSQGISDNDICFGIEDLSRHFTLLSDPKGIRALKIRLNNDNVARLRKWDWLIDKIGHEGIDEFIRLVKLGDRFEG